MALSQNTLQRRKSIRAAHENSNVFRAGNPPARRRLTNGNKVVAPTIVNRPPQNSEEVHHKAMHSRFDQDRHMNEGPRSAGNVQKSLQTHDEQADAGAIDRSAETAVDSPFSQMSITEQERKHQPPQPQPPAANMMYSRLSTAEPGEIREDSPGARRRGKLPVRSSPRPTTSVPQFGGINQPLRSDVVPESPLSCTENDTPGSSALSPESMAIEETMRIVQQLEARRDAEDGLYEPSQAGTPWQCPSLAAQEELAREAELLARDQARGGRRKRASAAQDDSLEAEGAASASRVPTEQEVENIGPDDDSALDVRKQPQSTSFKGDFPASTVKRRSPEPHNETPQKRRKATEKEEGLLQSRSYHALKEKGRAERDGLLATINSMWNLPCHEAIPRNLWVHNSKGYRVEPRDWATNRILVPMRALAVLTPRRPDSAVKALRQAISERTRISPLTPVRIHVENDLVRAIQIVKSRPEGRSQTIGRSQAVGLVGETLPDVLGRTVEPPRQSFYHSSPEPAEQDLDGLRPTLEPVGSSLRPLSPEPAAEDTDNSNTIAKVDSASVSPTVSAMPMKIESSPPAATPSSRLLHEPKLREEVLQMTPRELMDHLRESEKRLDDAYRELYRRIDPSRYRPGELSALKRDQLKEYYRVAKAEWELADEVYDKMAEHQSRRDAIIVID